MRTVTKRRWQVALDVALGLFLAFTVVVGTLDARSYAELVGGLLVVAGSVVTARRYPALSLGIALAGALAVPFPYGDHVPVWVVFVLVAMSYQAGLRMPRARPGILTGTAIAILGLPIALVFGPDGLGDWAAMVAILVFAGLSPWLLGRYVRVRGELARTGWRRAEEMESRQRLVAEQARLRERARIASDMHDSLGHELSLIAVRAAALEVASGLDDAQRDAAAQLRTSAATATERLREIIGVLREDAAPVEPVQGDLGELIARARASGLLIESTVDTADAPPMVARAAYRVVQEALTNVAKHAPGAAVTVRVTSSGARTDVSVVNAAPPAGPLPGAASGHVGLIGLRERVRLVGGTLRAGPDAAGGFGVAAMLPHGAEPAELGASPDDDGEPSTSARALELARRDVRRSLIQAVAVPLGLFAIVLGVAGIAFLYLWNSSELPPGVYERLRIGQPRAEVAPQLPERERVARPNRGEPPLPAVPGVACEYYGTGRSWLDNDYAAYRLCFAGGRLVAKDRFAEGAS
ncbi:MULTISPECIES: histidine kinase [unclassified Amycolatopsis]|uniref:sensor histidine kinase n=1 Tax=unclassified Amycolatopsis TaxID=2618356 RepID=UPI0028746916|nr:MULTISPECIES: histidine kinase [unclassified Amycolatopsis]MDS0139119.1 sensor histidine kinase [Amycolatopsis sp. 505]MDS0144351.1 sensor histidine kinase [Amycolatopsis sp. CM201R]